MAPDSNSTTYTTAYSATITFGGWNCNSTSSYEPPKPRTLAQLSSAIRHYLSDAEKALMRLLNIEPTTKGIETCVEKHRLLCRAVKSLPHFRSRLDRRIPCWRSTRWKSLT